MDFTKVLVFLSKLRERVRVILLDRLYPITYPSVLWHYLVKNPKTMADIGCGKGGAIEFVRRRGLGGTVVGGDIYKPYILICKKKKLYSDCILCDACYLPFKEESFDLVLLIGVIEHLEKEDGLALLTQLNKLAKKRIVIFTAVGYLPQEKFNGNIYQKHRSGWHPEEFRKRGYRVYGVSGTKSMHARSFEGTRVGSDVISRFPLLRFITQPLAYVKPEIAYHMVCIKNK